MKLKLYRTILNEDIIGYEDETYLEDNKIKILFPLLINQSTVETNIIYFKLDRYSIFMEGDSIILDKTKIVSELYVSEHMYKIHYYSNIDINSNMVPKFESYLKTLSKKLESKHSVKDSSSKQSLDSNIYNIESNYIN